jgi:hypothetical protein
MAERFEVTEEEMDAWIDQAMLDCKEIQEDQGLSHEEKAVFLGLFSRCEDYKNAKLSKDQKKIDEHRVCVQDIFKFGEARQTICVPWPKGPRPLTAYELAVDYGSSVGRLYDRAVSLFLAYLLLSGSWQCCL